jgi:secreted trypsin-like serine protease
LKIRAFLILLLALTGCGQAPSPGSALTGGDAPAIFGGTKVERSASYWRSTVKIRMSGEFTMCTGALIGSGSIVTAGHCLDKSKPLSVVFFNGDREVASREVTASILHPRYNFANAAARNDIAVVRFRGGLPSSEFRAATLLADARALSQGSMLSIVGFGLWRASENGLSSMRVAKTRISSVGANAFLTYDVDKKAGGCDGDSGGPGFVETQDGLALAGVLSYVLSKDGTCDRSFVSGLTLVPFYADWIKSVQ